MSNVLRGMALCVVLASAARAQQPDSTRRRPSTRADSLKAIQDSIALMRELESAQQPTTAPAQQPAVGAQGPTNPRMLPDISAVGDLIGDFSPNGSTQADLSRFSVREVEVAIQAPIDPYFRGDVFLGVNDLEKIAIEQAYMTATSLPWQVEGRMGRFLMPVGKQNTTHRHDLHTIDYPYVIQRFFGDEGLKGTGLYASKVFAPFGFYQEVQLTAVDRLRERPEGLVTDVAVNKKLDGLAYSARLRNYWDLNQATNLEVSASGITGKIEQPFTRFVPDPTNPVNAIPVRQSVVGADFTFRWRPLQQGLYKSFILQGEFMRQLNGKGEISGYEGPMRDFNGAYLFGRYQLTQRLFVGARYDWLQDPDLTGTSTFARTLMAGSGYLEWFPSEFSKLVAGYERVRPEDFRPENRILLQASFAIGPHKPHPF